MPDLFGHTKPRKPVTAGDKVRRAVWRAIREAPSPWEVSAGPIAAALKMEVPELVGLWMTEGYRYSYCRIADGEFPDTLGWEAEKIAAFVRALPDHGALLLGVDGE